MFKRDYAVKAVQKENAAGMKWVNYYLTYNEVVKAKEKVQEWVDEEMQGCARSQLINSIIDMPVPQRVVIAAGEFIDQDDEWQFLMPSTKEVLEFEISDIDSEKVENGAIVYISSSAISGTDIGFFREEKTSRIVTGKYRKEVC